MDSLARRLASAMKAAGLSQAGLARAASNIGAKVSQQVVQHLLAGRNKNSKHVPAIAQALGVDLQWLLTGKGNSGLEFKTPIICYIGAGSEVHPIDDHAQGQGIELVDAPKGINQCVAAIIRGDSMLPLRDGWLIFWAKNQDGVPEECIGQLCVVQLKDGPTLVKEVRRGAKKGVFTLESWNARPRENVRLEWAARVMDIRPR